MAAAAAAVDADAVARIVAITTKAAALCEKGHYARAANKYGAAGAAAALASHDQDCLITAFCQLEQANCLFATLFVPEAAEAHAAHTAAAQEQVFGSLLPAAMRVVERRRSAGTLQPGACRPAEEAFYHAHTAALCDLARAAGVPLGDGEARHRMSARLFGYDATLMAASVAMYALVNDGACADACARTRVARFVAAGMDTMVAAPRAQPPSRLNPENEFMVRWDRLLRSGAICSHDADHMIVMLAWQRLVNAGVLSASALASATAAGATFRTELAGKARAAAAASGLQRCALPECCEREAHAAHFKRCGACKCVSYCSKAHQAADWASHKAACKAARGAAAGDDAASDAP
jgi:hypothetical protein